MRLSLPLILLLAFFLTSCFERNRPREERTLKKVWGYKPVYTTDSSILRIVADSARSVKRAGKIYAYNNLILQSETGEGIHVLDKTDPSNLKNLGFLRIKGNSEMSIKGSHLYVNSYTDLVVVDISDWRRPVEIKRLKNAFQHGALVPGYYHFIPLPERGVYYDCVSPRNGFQSGWVRDSVLNYCYYN